MEPIFVSRRLNYTDLLCLVFHRARAAKSQEIISRPRFRHGATRIFDARLLIAHQLKAAARHSGFGHLLMDSHGGLTLRVAPGERRPCGVLEFEDLYLIPRPTA